MDKVQDSSHYNGDANTSNRKARLELPLTPHQLNRADLIFAQKEKN